MSLTVTEPLKPVGSLDRTVADLRRLAVRGLSRMYRPATGRFAFTLRRSREEEVLEGDSCRYTAIALIGLARAGKGFACGACGKDDPAEVGERLAAEVEYSENLGDLALTLWACVELGIPQASQVRGRLLTARPWEGVLPTVELAWALTALSKDEDEWDAEATRRLADRLAGSFRNDSAMFPHGLSGAVTSRLRAHVTCFADLVYSIQALSHYYRRARRDADLGIAQRCAERMCSLQGSEGQWWWHYDVRTGRVLERYPVYAVHQHAMAPMALKALESASGTPFEGPVLRGLRWLLAPVEIVGSLIDWEAGVVWRKVGRWEPGKMTRTLQALASQVHPRLRVPGLGLLFRPGNVDWECRPYELGWLLYAWSEDGRDS